MFKLIVSTFLAALLVGCATPATHQAMSITAQDLTAAANPELRGQLQIRNISGGKDTNPLWTSQVDAQGFKAALDKSIAVAGYKAADGAAGGDTR